tara:strand:+ start:40852 stop:41280 length:429 start_codon:yes stop_codon:yes gene_type:complete
MLKRLLKNPVFYLLLLVLLVCLLIPKNRYEGFENSNCELSPAEFKKKSQNSKLFTLFYANWCGHCKNMKPQWESAANKVNTNGVKMVMVDLGDKDDAAQEQLRKDYNIRGYPTIVDIENGEKTNDYSGERSESALVEHAKSL